MQLIFLINAFLKNLNKVLFQLKNPNKYERDNLIID